MKRTLYLTVDGILQPLGYSQVFRVVEGLARQGVPYAVVSMEREEDLAQRDRVEAMTARLRDVGVDWTALPYRQGNAAAAAGNLSRLFATSLARTRRGDLGLVHARSYHGAAIAFALRAALRIPYLFDARSYWIDERLEAGRWFRKPAVIAGARVAEKAMYRSAAGLVTLTQLQADDASAGRFGPWGSRPLEVIPTCADFEEFRVRPRDEAPDDIRTFARGGPVIGFVGSVNASYRFDRAIELVRRIVALRDDVRIVALGADPKAYERIFDEAGIDRSRIYARRIEHDRVAAYVASLDWGMLLLAETFAKRASMPTKLGEFFAAGVRPIHHGCNAEVGHWVRRTGSGLSLPDLDDETLDRAARCIANTPRDANELSSARAIAEQHFSLRGALTRYASLIRSLA